MTDDFADITAEAGETKKTLLWRKGEKIEITKGPDGLWRDPSGSIIALVDRAYETDTNTACGVGIFSLPSHWIITRACKPHDFGYSSPTYQTFHKRSEADTDLKKNVYLIEKEEIGSLAALLVSEAFHTIVAEIGGEWWDTPKSDDETPDAIRATPAVGTTDASGNPDPVTPALFPENEP